MYVAIGAIYDQMIRMCFNFGRLIAYMDSIASLEPYMLIKAKIICKSYMYVAIGAIYDQMIRMCFNFGRLIAYMDPAFHA